MHVQRLCWNCGIMRSMIFVTAFQGSMYLVGYNSMPEIELVLFLGRPAFISLCIVMLGFQLFSY